MKRVVAGRRYLLPCMGVRRSLCVIARCRTLVRRCVSSGCVWLRCGIFRIPMGAFAMAVPSGVQVWWLMALCVCWFAFACTLGFGARLQALSCFRRGASCSQLVVCAMIVVLVCNLGSLPNLTCSSGLWSSARLVGWGCPQHVSTRCCATVCLLKLLRPVAAISDSELWRFVSRALRAAFFIHRGRGHEHAHCQLALSARLLWVGDLCSASVVALRSRRRHSLIWCDFLSVRACAC